jgi:hypothetical protein
MRQACCSGSAPPFADFPDAQNFLFLAQSDKHALNVASFNNESFDRLMHEGWEPNIRDHHPGRYISVAP